MSQASARPKDYHVVELDVEQRLHSTLAVQTRAALAEQAPGATVEYPAAGVVSNVIKISGTHASVDGASKMLAASVAETHQVNMLVPKQLHVHIVGQDGATLAHVRQASGAQVQVPAADAADENIVVSGGKAQVEQATAMIREITESVTVAAEPEPAVRSAAASPSSPKEAARDLGNVASQMADDAELIMEVHAPEEFHRFLIGKAIAITPHGRIAGYPPPLGRGAAGGAPVQLLASPHARVPIAGAQRVRRGAQKSWLCHRLGPAHGNCTGLILSSPFCPLRNNNDDCQQGRGVRR